MDPRKLVTATLLGVIVFLIKGPLLAPYADFLVVFEAMLVGLGFALLGKGGGTFVELINGVLLTIYEASTVPVLAPFVLPLALLFGALIDLFGSFLKAKVGPEVNARKLAIAVTVSSVVTGVIAFFATAPTLISLGFIPDDQSMLLGFGAAVVLVGVIEGALGGYLAARTWDKSLKEWFRSIQTSTL